MTGLQDFADSQDFSPEKHISNQQFTHVVKEWNINNPVYPCNPVILTKILYSICHNSRVIGYRK